MELPTELGNLKISASLWFWEKGESDVIRLPVNYCISVNVLELAVFGYC